MGIAVPAEEILEPGDAGRCRRADEDRAAGAGADQRDPAEDERAHDALAKLGLGDQQRPEVLRRDQQRLDLALGMAVDQRRLAGQRADLGEELARTLLDHRRDMAEAVMLGDRDVAGEHRRTCPATAGRSRTSPRRGDSVRSVPKRRIRSISRGVSDGKVCA